MTAAVANAAPLPDLRLIERPPTADVQQEKTWLLDQQALDTSLGRVMIGITLVEDLAVVILTVTLPALGVLTPDRLIARSP